MKHSIKTSAYRVVLNADQVSVLDSIIPDWRDKVGFKLKRRKPGRKGLALTPFADTDFEPAIIVNFDGSCWPNPGGTPSFAWVITSPDGNEIRDGDGIAANLHFDAIRE